MENFTKLLQRQYLGLGLITIDVVGVFCLTVLFYRHFGILIKISVSNFAWHSLFPDTLPPRCKLRRSVPVFRRGFSLRRVPPPRIPIAGTNLPFLRTSTRTYVQRHTWMHPPVERYAVAGCQSQTCAETAPCF